MASSKKTKKAKKKKSSKSKHAIDPRWQWCEQRFKNLLALSSQWYWEQDENFRFTLFMGEAFDKSGIDTQQWLGQPRWRPETAPLGDGGNWDAHKATLKARQAFGDFIYLSVDSQGNAHYLSATGQPDYDDAGQFKGYRGIAKDATERVQAERRLIIGHAAARVLAESNSISEAAPEIIKIICESLGWECGARWELDGQRNMLRCAETWGIGSAPVEAFLASMKQTPPQAGQSPLRSFARLETAWIRDLSDDATFPYAREAVKTGLRNAFTFPIKAGSQVLGAVVLFASDMYRPDPDLIGCATDIGGQMGQFWQRTRAEERLREIGDRFQSLTELSSDWYWEQDENFRFTARAGGPVTREVVRSDDIFGKTRWQLPYVNVTEEQWAEHKALLQAHKPFHNLVLMRRLEDGTLRHISISGRPFFDDNGNFKGYRGIGKDITDQRHADERIQYLASHDALTTLPNRVMFSEILDLAIHTARRYNRSFAVMFLDLDRFKNINDTFGHDAGDTLLKEMGLRLTQTLRASDVVARLGGDEFVMLVQEIGEQKYIAAVARKILSAVIKPMMLFGQECRVTASIGICLYPADAQDEQTLMKNADIAMYRAKEEGKNNYKFYSEQLNVHTLERLALETSLRRALERNEFFLHYQAKLDLTSGQITGSEALIRWQHPDLGMVSPAQFIPLAEETGLIVPIGKWVVRTACAQNMAWQKQGLTPICIAVNLSPRQFADDELLKDLAAILEDTGMPGRLLELEITEGMVMQNPDRAIKVLTAIKDMGIRLAIDDFGTGYSSLAQIKRFPIDTLKVDRSFIREIPLSVEDRAITEAIIAMGKTLSLTVVAEGVETQEQQKFLRDHDCDEMQGFYFSKPVTPDLFADLVRKHVATPKKEMK